MGRLLVCGRSSIWRLSLSPGERTHRLKSFGFQEGDAHVSPPCFAGTVGCSKQLPSFAPYPFNGRALPCHQFKNKMRTYFMRLKCFDTGPNSPLSTKNRVSRSQRRNTGTGFFLVLPHCAAVLDHSDSHLTFCFLLLCFFVGTRAKVPCSWTGRNLSPAAPTLPTTSPSFMEVRRNERL